MTALENVNDGWFDYSPRFQKYSCGLSLINCCILLVLGGCVLIFPSFVIHILLDYSMGDDDDDLPPTMLLSVTRMAGGVLLAQGISSIALSALLLRDWLSNSPTIREISVATHRVAIGVQSVTGLLWVVVGLLDDRMTETHGDPNDTRRETFGLLVVGFAMLILSCWALMLSYWPVYGENTSTPASAQPTRRTNAAPDGENPLMEPLLSSNSAAEDEDESVEVVFRPLEDPPEVNNTADQTNDEEPSNDDDDNDEHTPTSRIRGTRRLLKLAAPQVTYLYIGCITLLVRLPFSLSIPHFVSTTLGALARGDYVQARSEIFWLFLLGTIDACLDFWCIFWFGYANLRIVKGVRVDTFAAILRQEMAFFDKHTSGELASRLTSDCGEMAGDLTWFFRFSIESVVRITGITAYMLIRCPRLGACALSIVPLVAVVNKYYGNWLNRNARKVQDATAAANSVAQETLSCMRTVIAFASEDLEHSKYTERVDDQYRLNVKQTFMTGIYYMFVSTFLINTVVQGSLLLIGSFMIQRGQLSAEILLAFMLYQGQLQNEMMNLFQSYSSLIKSSGAGDKVFALLDRSPPAPATGSEETTDLTVNENDCSALSLELQNVRFAYPSRPEHPVLKGIDLVIKEGQTLALVGPSGCGKSTIVSLLQRFYDPIYGRVLAGNVNIKEMGIKEHRRRIGVVTQDPTLFSGTILSNITYGMTDGTREQAIEAAKQANAHDFITSFPNGYETEVGERGVQLSGGQKQRIAISRAIIRNPSLLLLDEATSALDADSEEIVQAALDNLLNSNQGITTVIIAHRLRTVRNADVIAVVNEGRIVETGSHQDLMKLETGYYKGMVEKSLGGKLPSA